MSMEPHRIVRGQPVSPAKIALAKEMRRAMTDAEQLLWHALRGSRLADLHFRRQQIVYGYIADFYCHSAALVVEVDGPIHEGQRDQDVARDLDLAGQGFRTLRFTNDQVTSDLSTVL